MKPEKESEVLNLKPPSLEVLKAFGATEKPVRIVGGQGQNYQSGSVILKPAKDDEETNWIAEFYLAVDEKGFRLPKPICSDRDSFVVDGWQAWEYMEGNHIRGHWDEIIDVCIQFHQAIATIPKPAFFDRREQNPWVIADKVTWGEMGIEYHPRIASAVGKLRRCLREISGESQLIHGDFGGNVLFSDNLPPAIIDFSPYWRPLEFAIGIIIVDAIVWEGADMSLLEAGNRFSDFDQYLLRAELRRIIELDTLYKMYGWQMLEQIDAHLPLVDVISSRYR